MPKTLAPHERARAQRLYDRMTRYQETLWELTGKLENIIGCAVDSTGDLKAHSLDYYIEKDEAI